MRKTLLAMLTLSSVLLTSTSALARDLDEDMDVLNDNYKVVLKTDSLTEMTSALTAMRQATQDAKRATPPKLEGKAPNGPEMTDYRHGLDILTDQIDGALGLAGQGKLKEAQAAAGQFKGTRSVYHKKYR